MAQKNKFKIGIIGVGKMGTLHLTKFQTIPLCEVIGLYDSDPARAKQVSEQCGTRFFQKLEELFFESDAVVVASSSNSHYTIVKQALDSGLHVLVEKPLALSSKEAWRLSEQAKNLGLVLQVGFVERFRLNEMTKKLDFRRIKQIECERITETVGREPSLDVVTDLMIHDLDLILSMKLGKITSVSARGTSVLHETTDIAVADLRFESGTQVHLLANRLGPHASRKMRILMEGQYCKIDLGLSTLTLVTEEGTRCQQIDKGRDFLLEQALSFCDAIVNQKEASVTARDGAVSLELTEAILDSIKPFQPLDGERRELEN